MLAASYLLSNIFDVDKLKEVSTTQLCVSLSWLSTCPAATEYAVYAKVEMYGTKVRSPLTGRLHTKC